MNKTRRKMISDLSTEVAAVIAIIEDAEADVSWPAVKETISDLHSNCEALKDEEQEYLDNMPEGLKNGDKGDTAQSAITELENAAMELEGAETAAGEETPDADEVVGNLNTAIEHLNEAEA
jgi:hypothetical protein